jgi:CheY-like chemotaxis protein
MAIMQKIANDTRIQEKILPDDLWTVFLVEDDLDDQMMTERVLRNSPYIGQVICVPESISLFDYLAKHQHHAKKYDPSKILILLDIYMPGLNGLMLLEQLRVSPHTCDLPVIIITGDQNPEKIFQSYRRNASGFINKPITKEHLIDIHTIIEYGSYWYRSN